MTTQLKNAARLHDQQRIKQLIRIKEVSARVGYGKAMLYRLIRQGRFCSSVRLGPNSVAWDAEEVEAWINERIAASRKGAA